MWNILNQIGLFLLRYLRINSFLPFTFFYNSNSQDLNLITFKKMNRNTPSRFFVFSELEIISS